MADALAVVGKELVRHARRVDYGGCVQSRLAIRASASACGRCAENDSLILVRSSSTRQAIFTSIERMVANVAPRHRDLFGAAKRIECSSQ